MRLVTFITTYMFVVFVVDICFFKSPLTQRYVQHINAQYAPRELQIHSRKLRKCTSYLFKADATVLVLVQRTEQFRGIETVPPL